MLWLSIYLPLLPLQVFNQTNSNHDHEQALIVVWQHKVLLCNPMASQCGIEPGLAINTARGLCETVHIEERDQAKERAVLQRLAESVYQFSSQVSCHVNCHSENSLLLEIGGSLRLFNGIEQLQQQLSQLLHGHPLSKPHGFQHHLAVASTAKAAELLARFYYHKGNNSKQAVIHKTLPSSVPVTLLDIETKQLKQCVDMGITELNQLLQLPAAALTRRLGVDITRHLEQLTGRQDDPQSIILLPPYFEREKFYIDGLRSHNDLLHPIQQLLTDLCDYLRIKQLRSRTIEWTFHRFSRQKHGITIQCSEPLSDFEALLSLTTLKLDQIPIDSPIETVSLQAISFEMADTRTGDLFERKNRAASWHLLADKLIARLGARALTKVSTKNHHFPESINRVDAIGSERQQIAVLAQTIPGRPAWLLQSPEQLLFIDNDIYYRSHKLSLLKGPERIEGNWWENHYGDSRDYFVAASINPLAERRAVVHHSQENQQARYQAFYWIYYDRKMQQWYLHGLF